jgi:hypothetical protein
MVDFIAEDGIATINFDANRPHIGVVDAFGKRSTTLVTNGTEGAGVDIYGVGTSIIGFTDSFLIRDILSVC